MVVNNLHGIRMFWTELLATALLYRGVLHRPHNYKSPPPRVPPAYTCACIRRSDNNFMLPVMQVELFTSVAAVPYIKIAGAAVPADLLIRTYVSRI